MPGAAMGELRLLDQQHVLCTVARQMIGKRRADGAAANNQNVDVSVPVHDFTRSFVGS